MKILFLLLILSSCSHFDKMKPFSCQMKKTEVIEHKTSIVEQQLFIEPTLAHEAYLDSVFMMANYFEYSGTDSINNLNFDDGFESLNKAFNGYLFLVETYPDDSFLIAKIGSVYNKIKKYYLFRVESTFINVELQNKINKIPFK